MRLVYLLPLAGVVAVACGGKPAPTGGEGPAPVAAEAGPDGNERLGRSIVPTRYVLDLTVDPAQPTFKGAVAITVKVEAPTASVRLHAEGLELATAQAEVAGERRPAEVRMGPNGGLALDFAQPLPAGEVVLHFDYQGKLGQVPHGLYRVEEGDAWYAFTQFEALHAREAFPSFDQPEFKTPFVTTLRVPEGQLAFTNGPETARTTEGGVTTFTFAETKPLPTYLVAFAMGPLEVVPAPADAIPGTPLRILATRGKGKLAGYALERTPVLHAALSAYFDLPHPFAKLDQVAVPNFSAGAMENVGLVTYRETLLLLDGATAPAQRKMWSQAVVAHELAHMWFGNLVTPTWWNDLWLNEAFATWMSGRTVAEVDPALEMDLEQVWGAQFIMLADSKKDTRAIRQPIRHGGDINNAFDGITYGKGAAVLRMLEAWVGAEAFRDGVRAYVRAHAHGNATTADLMNALEKATGKPVGAVAAGFLDQPGVPLVQMTLTCAAREPATLTMKQARYLPVGSQAGAGEPWRVPVCVRYGMGGEIHRQCTVLEGPEGEMTLNAKPCPDWLHGNADQKGYYQWTLAPEAMRELAAARYDDLSQAERVALPGVLAALVDADALPIDAWLGAITALGKRSHRLVIEGVLAALGQIERVAVDDASRPAFQAWVRAVLAPHAAALGDAPREGEKVADTLLRPQVLNALAHLGGDAEVRAKARATVERWLKDHGGVAPDVLAQALPVAAWGGDAALWQRLRTALDDDVDPVTRVAIIGALGAFEDPALATRSLDLLLDGTLRAQDLRTVARSVRRPARDAAWDWMTGNHAAIVERIGKQSAAALPWMAGGFCTAEAREKVAAFFAEPAHAPEGTARNLSLVLEEIDRCVGRRGRLQPAVKAWLAARGPEGR